MTPNLAVVCIDSPHRRGIHLWLPLFLLWIPVILLSPLILIVVLVLCLVGQVNPWRAIATFWNIACSLPGTDVRVLAEGNRILVRIL